MSFLRFLCGLLQTTAHDDTPAMGSIERVESANREFVINPATGLPMQNGVGGVDVAGNPYGIDVHHSPAFSHEYTYCSSDDSGSDTGISGSSFSDPFSQ